MNKNGEVLIVSQRGRSWSLPKGHIDEGEEAIDAAKREIYEESGIKDLTFIKNLGSYERFKIGLDPDKDDTSELKKIFMFLFKTNEEKLAPIDTHNPEAHWLKVGQVSSKLSHRKDREFFNKITYNLKDLA